MANNNSLISKRKSAIFCSTIFFLSSLIGFILSDDTKLAILSLIVSLLFIFCTVKLTYQINTKK